MTTPRPNDDDKPDPEEIEAALDETPTDITAPALSPTTKDLIEWDEPPTASGAAAPKVLPEDEVLSAKSSSMKAVTKRIVNAEWRQPIPISSRNRGPIGRWGIPFGSGMAAVPLSSWKGGRLGRENFEAIEGLDLVAAHSRRFRKRRVPSVSLLLSESLANSLTALYDAHGRTARGPITLLINTCADRSRDQNGNSRDLDEISDVQIIVRSQQVCSTLDVVDIQRSCSHAETGTREADGLT
jgi:hypothetical protein